VSHRVARAFARVLVAMYPREFREEFGASMVRDFCETFASRRTAFDRARFIAAAIVDAVRSAAAERAASHTPAERGSSMYGVTEDIRFGARALLRRPGFVAAVVLTLALGIGANTAVFSLVDAVFLRPVAVTEPERVVAIFHALSANAPNSGLSYPVYRAMRDGSQTLDGVAVAMSHPINVAGPAGNELLNSGVVSGNYFSVLGITPFAGRLVSESDDGAHGASPVIVISHRLWRRWSNADPNMVGKTVKIANRAFTIVGVAPPAFRGTELADVADLWAPVSMLTSLGFGGLYAPEMDAELFRTTAFHWLDAVGRVKPGVTHDVVAGELNRLLKRLPPTERRLLNEEPAAIDPMSVMPITRSAALRDRDSLVRFVRLMFGVVALTLLLACANVANLLLVRSSERAQELGVRAALGAGRSRIVRQLLIESAMLAAVGAVVGLGVAIGTVRTLAAFQLPGSIALAELDLALDARVLMFTALVAVGTALAFGLLPAFRASRFDLAALLRNERASRGGAAIRNTLVAMQVALALVLLIGATLFTRSLRAGLATDIGFDARPLAAVDVDLRLHGYDRARMLAYYAEAERRLRARPEIERVALATHVPLSRGVQLPFKAKDAVTAEGKRNIRFLVNGVSDDYFTAIGLPIVQGRVFSNEAADGPNRVIILNEAAAKRFWGSASPIGRSVNLFGGEAFTVVGIVPTTKSETVTDEAVPTAFLPLVRQAGFGNPASIVVRSAAPAAALRAAQQELRAIDRGISLRRPRLVGNQIDDVLMPQRFGTRLFAIFSLIALVVASIGVHGVVSYGVSLRRRELGIRIALGAQSSHIYWTVLRASLIAVAIGCGVGVAVGVVGSPALAVFLYGIRPLDGAAFGIAALALAVAAVGATVVPARRASRTDPVTSMRTE
jgi:predicted permease